MRVAKTRCLTGTTEAWDHECKSPRVDSAVNEFTVLTATFNRASTLPRVYESLRDQTFRDFEWLIVDDGSTDETSSLVAGWQRESNFPIRYIWQENAGKPSAINRGALLANGELLLILDSDDACVPTALERFKYHWGSIPKQIRPQFVGVTALVQRPDGSLVGTSFPSNPFDSTPLEIRRHVRGEKWGFLRTSVMREFPFPVFDGERYIPESIVWNRMARSYRTRYVNEVLRIYYESENGMSAPLARIRSPRGAIQVNRELLAERQRLPRSLVLRACANRVRFGLHAGEKLREHRKDMPSLTHWIGALPTGFMLYTRDQYLTRSQDH